MNQTLPNDFYSSEVKSLLATPEGRIKLAYAWANIDDDEATPEAGFADPKDEDEIIICCPATGDDMSFEEFSRYARHYNGAISCHADLAPDGSSQVSLYLDPFDSLNKTDDVFDTICYIQNGTAAKDAEDELLAKLLISF